MLAYFQAERLIFLIKKRLAKVFLKSTVFDDKSFLDILNFLFIYVEAISSSFKFYWRKQSHHKC